VKICSLDLLRLFLLSLRVALVFTVIKGLLELEGEEIQVADVSSYLDYIVKNRSEFQFSRNMTVNKSTQYARKYARTILRFQQAVQDLNMEHILNERSESVDFMLQRLQESVQGSLKLYTKLKTWQESGHVPSDAESAEPLKNWTGSDIQQVMVHWTQLQNATEEATRMFHNKTGGAYPLARAVFSSDWRINDHRDVLLYKSQETNRAIHDVEVVNAILVARRKRMSISTSCHKPQV